MVVVRSATTSLLALQVGTTSIIPLVVVAHALSAGRTRSTSPSGLLQKKPRRGTNLLQRGRNGAETAGAEDVAVLEVEKATIVGDEIHHLQSATSLSSLTTEDIKALAQEDETGRKPASSEDCDGARSSFSSASGTTTRNVVTLDLQDEAGEKFLQMKDADRMLKQDKKSRTAGQSSSASMDERTTTLETSADEEDLQQVEPNKQERTGETIRSVRVTHIPAGMKKPYESSIPSLFFHHSAFVQMERSEAEQDIAVGNAWENGTSDDVLAGASFFEHSATKSRKTKHALAEQQEERKEESRKEKTEQKQVQPQFPQGQAAQQGVNQFGAGAAQQSQNINQFGQQQQQLLQASSTNANANARLQTQTTNANANANPFSAPALQPPQSGVRLTPPEGRVNACMDEVPWVDTRLSQQEQLHHAFHVTFFAQAGHCGHGEEIRSQACCRQAGEHLFGEAVANNIVANNFMIHQGPNLRGCWYQQGPDAGKQLFWKTVGDPRDLRHNHGPYLRVCKVFHAPLHHPPIFYPLMFLLVALVVSVCVSYTGKLINGFLPPSLLLVLFGFATNFLGYLSGPESEIGYLVEQASHCDPHVIFWLLLPMLLYEDGSGSDWRVLRPIFVNAVILAVPGVAISFLIMGCLIRTTFPLPPIEELHPEHVWICFWNQATGQMTTQERSFSPEDPRRFALRPVIQPNGSTQMQMVRRSPQEWQTLYVNRPCQVPPNPNGGAVVIPDPTSRVDGAWPWMISFLLGAILSATDPVAVIAALKQLGAPARLSLLVAGEALLNDATGVVFFNLFWELASTEADFDPAYALWVFFRLACLGPVVACLGMGVMHGVLKVTNHIEVKNFLFMTVFVVFFLFFFSEQTIIGVPLLPVSAVLAVVVFSFYVAAIGQNMILLNGGEHLSHAHHEVIGFIAGVCNDTIFYVAGVVMARYLFFSSMLSSDWMFLGICYLYCHLARGIAMFSLMPVMNFFGFGVSWKEGIIGVFGGLRGAVGLAMALQVAMDHGNSPLDLGFRLRIGFHVSGIALLTLSINGVVFGKVYNALKLYPPAIQPSQTKMLKCATLAEGIIFERLQEMKSHWLFCNISAEAILGLVPRISDMLADAAGQEYGGGHGGNNPSTRNHELQDDLLNAVQGGRPAQKQYSHTMMEAMHHLHHEFHGSAYYEKQFVQLSKGWKAEDFRWEQCYGLTSFIIPSASESFAQRSEDGAAWLQAGFGQDYSIIIDIFFGAVTGSLQRLKRERCSMAVWPADEISEALEFTHEAMQGVLRSDNSLDGTVSPVMKMFFKEMPMQIWTESPEIQEKWALEVGFCKLFHRLFGTEVPMDANTGSVEGGDFAQFEHKGRTLLFWCLLMENTRASLQPIVAVGIGENSSSSSSKFASAQRSSGRARENSRNSAQRASNRPSDQKGPANKGPMGEGEGRGGSGASGSIEAGTSSSSGDESTTQEHLQNRAFRTGQTREDLIAEYHAAMQEDEEDVEESAADSYDNFYEDEALHQHADPALLDDSGTSRSSGTSSTSSASSNNSTARSSSSSLEEENLGTATAKNASRTNNFKSRSRNYRETIPAFFSIFSSSSQSSSGSENERSEDLNTNTQRSRSSPAQAQLASSRNQNHVRKSAPFHLFKQGAAAEGASTTTDVVETRTRLQKNLVHNSTYSRPSTASDGDLEEFLQQDVEKARRGLFFDGAHEMPSTQNDQRSGNTSGRASQQAVPQAALAQLDVSLRRILYATRVLLIKAVFEKYPRVGRVWLHAIVTEALTQDLYKQLELSATSGLLTEKELGLFHDNVFHAVTHAIQNYRQMRGLDTFAAIDSKDAPPGYRGPPIGPIHFDLGGEKNRRQEARDVRKRLRGPGKNRREQFTGNGQNTGQNNNARGASK
ncbi:unnamed protein product [Amoebophrya sp. A120]|nr:unnamed protein product [Amoebophrya sp. A120]|eukprot:GSA120T00022338001.1